MSKRTATPDDLYLDLYEVSEQAGLHPRNGKGLPLDKHIMVSNLKSWLSDDSKRDFLVDAIKRVLNIGMMSDEPLEDVIFGVATMTERAEMTAVISAARAVLWRPQ